MYEEHILFHCRLSPRLQPTLARVLGNRLLVELLRHLQLDLVLRGRLGGVRLLPSLLPALPLVLEVPLLLVSLASLAPLVSPGAVAVSTAPVAVLF